MEKQVPMGLIPLRKSTSTYKLIIPVEVEKKIRHLCNRISQVEWSGTLFYTYSGSYEEGTLEIKCVDIFPMDIGSHTYTEFNMSPDVIAYMTNHPELLDCQMGLIHSHNNMATFFSGTDTDTLREEGRDRNHFVSLIVNNTGTYTAAITRKLTIKKVVEYTYTYKSFNDNELIGKGTSEEEEEVIEYNMLDIVKEGQEYNSFLELDDRLKEIKESKEKKSLENKTKPVSSYKESLPYTSSAYYSKPKESVRETSLFNEDYVMESAPPRIVSADPNEPDIVIPPALVRSLTLQLITGSIAIADASRIDPSKWANQMVKLFDKRFESNMSIFKEWAEMLVEFLFTNFIPKEYEEYVDEYIMALEDAVYMSLDKLPKNKYIKEIQNAILWISQ